MWNGFGEQMTTVFLPSPRLSGEMRPLREPNWDRLHFWYELRQQFLGFAQSEEPAPRALGGAEGESGDEFEVTTS
jgi:hypothetical protein